MEATEKSLGERAKEKVEARQEQLERDLFRVSLERDAYKDGFERERKAREEAEGRARILEQRLVDVNTRLQLALEQLQKGRNQRFGKSSETADALQLQWLFDEAEVTAAADGDGRQEEKAEEEGTEVKAHVRKKHKRHDLTVLPSTTPVLEIDHTEDCPVPVDPNTGSAMVLVGVKAEDKVGFIPAATYIERHLFPVYAPAEGYDGDEGESLRRVSYPLHTRVLKGVMVTDSLAAEVMAQKFCDHLPLYRQQDILARRGLAISRQSMARWIIDAARALKPLGALIRSQVLQRRLVNMDETSLQVLHEPGRESGKESYMMVQVGSGGGPPVVNYTYDRYHNADVLGSLIEGFSGVLQTDGLSGYAVAMGKLAESGRDCVHLGCWSHARRGFTAMGKGAIGKDSLPFIKRIGKLYSIERKLRAKWNSGEYADEQAFVDERVALTEEVLAGIHALAREKAERAMEGSEFSKALKYVLNQWPRLVEYPHHFDATPDNNAAERHTRPLSLGARNWLFANTAAGAESSALIYTLTENAKLSGVNPHEYLWALLEQAPSCRDEADWEQLLPWKIDLREIQAKKSLISSARPIEGRAEDYTIRGGLY